MTTQEATHIYWVLSSVDRGLVRYYQLTREDQARVSFDHNTRSQLLAAIDDMPARLAERVIMESRSW